MNEGSSPKSIASATLWTTLDFVLGRGLAFAVMVVLARLLTPAEFGTVALLALFVALANHMVEGGFGQALVQRPDISEADTSTVFWINIAVAGLLAALLAGLAPLIAAFFGLPVLIPLTWIMAASVFLGAFGTVQRALMVRAMAFRQLTAVRLAASAVSGAVAVVLALKDFGVYALAAQSLVAAIITSIMLWILSRWRPQAIFRGDSARRLFGFGGYVLVSGFLEVLYSRGYTLLIGKFHGPADLGQFVRAETATALVSGVVIYPMTQVAFPAFARMNGDTGRMVDGMRSALRTGMLFNAVAMLGLAAVAAPFVRTLYGPQWEPAIPLLQILCLGSVLMPVHVLNLQALMALGRSDLYFRLELLKKLVGVAILVAGSHWGPTGVAWGIVITGIVAAFINARHAGRLMGYGTGRQSLDIAPMLAVAGAVGMAAHLAVRYADDLSEPVRLLVGMLAGATVLLVAGGGAKALGFDIGINLPKRRT